MSKTTFSTTSVSRWRGQRLKPPVGWCTSGIFAVKLIAITAALVLCGSVKLFAQLHPSIQWQNSYGGSSFDQLDQMYTTADGGLLMIGESSSPVSGDKSQPTRGSSDFWIVKTDGTGNKIWDRTYGSAWSEVASAGLQTSSGGHLIVGTVTNDTGGSNPDPGDISNPSNVDDYTTDGWIINVDGNGNKLWDLMIGEPHTSESIQSVTSSGDGGFVLLGTKNSAFWMVKVSGTGQKLWEKTYESQAYGWKVVKTPDGGYLLAGTIYGGYVDEPERTGGPDYWMIKTDTNGNKLWGKIFGSENYISDFLSDMIATDDGGALLVGISYGGISHEKTAASKGGGDIWIVKTDANGNKLWDTAYGTSQEDYPQNIARSQDGGYFILARTAGGADGDKTEESFGGEDNWVLKITASGTKIWDKALGSTWREVSSYGTAIATSDLGVIIGTNSYGPADGNKTAVNKGEQDLWVVKLGCAASTETVLNQVSPVSQTACVMGTPEVLSGTDDDGLYPDLISYQWQRSANGTDGWTSIAVAVTKDYLPEPSANTMYYRRIASWECHKDTSNIATVTIGVDSAPSLNMGGPYYTCAGTAVVLGMNPVVSGGSAPYTYLWDNATLLDNPAAANPAATVNSTSIFTLTVTDASGCKKVGQALVNVPPPALAGPDRTYCPGTSGVRIGTAPLTGITGISYAWAPAAGLSSTSIAQPIASPASTTTYTLTVTYTNSAGTVCSVADQVTISVGSGPAPGFAGPDVTICSGAETVLGLPAQSGYSYTWSPGLYLMANDIAQPNFKPGTPFPPVVDPITYTVTATNGTCIYTDQVVVTVIKSDAGIDGCGPRTIGTTDLTPNVLENYSWTKLAGSTGTGNFTGATNLPQVQVSGTNSGEDIYELTVSHGGTSCVSTVRVPVCGNCGVDFIAEGGNCLLYGGKPLRLIADEGGSAEFTYTWSPAAGLSTTTGAVVYLLDGVNRHYTVTKTRISNPSDHCSVTKEVNPPALSFPVYHAPDVAACEGTPVTLGAPAVSGYSYNWAGPGGFTSNAPNPALTVTSATTGQYLIKVEDSDPAGSGGCFALDTVRVSIENLVAAGTNWTVCENAIVKLGAPDPSGGAWTYSWSPSVASWQNGTGPSSAQPEVLVTTNTTFTVTVTNATGCSQTATTVIQVSNSPTISDAADIVNACPGSSQQIGSPALPGVSYSWSPTAGLSNPNIAQPTVTVGGSGSTVTYTVTATFPGTCSATATDQVTVSAMNTNLDLGPAIVYCPASGPVNIGASVPTSGVYSYQWYPAVGLSSALVANPTTTVSVPTEYTLAVTYDNGCTGSGKVMVSPASAPNAGFDKTVCFGLATTLGAASNSAGAIWSGSGAAYLSSTSGPAVIFNPSGTAPAGTYTLTITQTTNGCTNSDDVTVTVGLPIQVPPGSAIVCPNSNGTMGTDAIPGLTYSWSPTTGLSDPNSARTGVTLATPGQYSYTLLARSMSTGCVSSANYVVTVSETSAPTVSLPGMAACLATPVVLQPSVSPTGNYSYNWTPAAGLSDPYSANPTATLSQSRTYTLSVVDNQTGCSSTASATIVVDQLDGNYIQVGPASSASCMGMPVTLSASVQQGLDYAYQWQWYNTSASTWENLADNGVYSGTNTLSLNISNNTGLNGAQYRIQVTTSVCGAMQASQPATLTVAQCQKSSIGDYVWHDLNRDGVQDPTESGVADVVVKLYRNGVFLASTTTAADGKYLFDQLDALDPFGNPYSYQVGFSNLPTDYIFTLQGNLSGGNGAGTANDSDVDPETGLSRPITLSYGENLLDVDAGVHSRLPMPVTLVNFNAAKESNTVVLNWATSWESNSQAFEVQRSPDARQWTTIGTVAARGESSSLSDYHYVDSAPLAEGSYYRLRMVDMDGTFAFSRIVAVDFNRSVQRASIFPNPVSDRLYIQNIDFSQVRQVSITNQSGVSQTWAALSASGIDLKGMISGLYLLQIRYKDESIEVHKVVVIR